ncbi:MAG: hypothetical protein O9256_02655 [Rhizobiaceae bacterium]|jgi:hypothetical protein|nr:hypothetical protein [Rhizobiaceae bacterium]
MRLSPKIAVFFVAAAVALWALAGYLQSKDEALAGVPAFLANAEEITKITGAQPTIVVHNSVFFQGVPGKEHPYREYRITAKGSQGNVDLTVRATTSEAQAPWSYQIRAINE